MCGFAAGFDTCRAHVFGGSAYLSLPDRVAKGRAVRAQVPRSVHGQWRPLAAGRLQRLANGQRSGDVGERQDPDQAAMLEHQATADRVGR